MWQLQRRPLHKKSKLESPLLLLHMSDSEDDGLFGQDDGWEEKFYAMGRSQDGTTLDEDEDDDEMEEFEADFLEKLKSPAKTPMKVQYRNHYFLLKGRLK